MYKFSKEQVLEPEFLTKLVRKFKDRERRRYRKAQRYYGVDNDIRRRSLPDFKFNNKIAHGFARYITNMATAYFIGKPIRYISEDEGLQEALNGIVKANNLHALNFEASKEASKKGIGFLLLYINEDTQLRIKKIDADDMIPVFSTSLGEYLECAVLLAEDFDIDGKLSREHAYVYDDTYIYHYCREDRARDFKEDINDRRAHMFDDVPVICILNNEDAVGDYETCYDIIDAYDRAQSNTSNDVDYFSDAYMAIVGAGGGLEEALTDGDGGDENAAAQEFRKNKLLFLDEKGQAYFIQKDTNDTATENYKDRLFKDLFFLAQVPALTDESFAGNLTGVAIKYKLTGLEELAIMKENGFRAAQNKMLKLITAFVNLHQNKNYEMNLIEQKYERNFVDNDTEIIENACRLENVVSRETQLSMLPQKIVGDVGKEIERMEREEAARELLPYEQTGED